MMNNIAPRIVFMGTPEFARTCLSRLVDKGFNIVGVVAQPDKKQGRGQKLTPPPVAAYARENNLPLFQPITFKNPDAVTELRSLSPDFLIVVAYGNILPQAVLDIPGRETLNVHASLLPKYRGAAPIHHALLNDEKETGVCIMRVTLKLDAGPVFSRAVTPIADDDTTETLLQKLAEIGAEKLCETLSRLSSGEVITPEEQDEKQATYAHKITRDMSAVDWNKNSRTIFNQVRALVPWPSATTHFGGNTLKILEAKPLPESTRGEPGTITHIALAGLSVATGAGTLLVTQLKPEGRNKMAAAAWASGVHLKVGDRFISPAPGAARHPLPKG